jgi:hypothetical protein
MSKDTTFLRFGDIRLAAIGYWTMLSLTILALYFPPFRYLAYLVPFIALYVGLADGHFQTGGINGPYIFLLTAGLFMSSLANTAGFKDLFFMCSGLSASIVLYRRPINTKLLLVLFSIGTVSFAIMYGGGLAHGLEYNLASSQSSFEGNFGFLFGILALYSALKKQNWIFFLSFLGAALALKRIVLVAILACWVISLLPDRIVRRILNPLVLVPINLAIILALVLYANHQFDYWLTTATGQSANQFGMGRQEIYATVARDIFTDPLRFLLFGAGPGAAYDSLGKFLGAANLHSDLLKIFFEYGLAVFCVFIWLGYRMHDVRVRILFLYANIIYATDNTLIYHFFLFFLCLTALALEAVPEEQLQDLQTGDQHAPAVS